MGGPKATELSHLQAVCMNGQVEMTRAKYCLHEYRSANDQSKINALHLPAVRYIEC